MLHAGVGGRVSDLEVRLAHTESLAAVQSENMAESLAQLRADKVDARTLQAEAARAANVAANAAVNASRCAVRCPPLDAAS